MLQSSIVELIPVTLRRTGTHEKNVSVLVNNIYILHWNCDSKIIKIIVCFGPRINVRGTTRFSSSTKKTSFIFWCLLISFSLKVKSILQYYSCQNSRGKRYIMLEKFSRLISLDDLDGEKKYCYFESRQAVHFCVNCCIFFINFPRNFLNEYGNQPLYFLPFCSRSDFEWQHMKMYNSSELSSTLICKWFASTYRNEIDIPAARRNMKIHEGKL